MVSPINIVTRLLSTIARSFNPPLIHTINFNSNTLHNKEKRLASENEQIKQVQAS